MADKQFPPTSMTHELALIIALKAKDDDHAKDQSVKVLQALGILLQENYIDLQALGISLNGPDGNIELPPPQFPKGVKL
jgi:hypothetical protein